MIFISWMLVIIAAIVVIQLPALPFRNMLKKSYQEILKAWDRFLKIWNSFPYPARFIIAIISFLVLACGVMFLYKFHGLFDIIFLSKEEQNLDKEALSNIRRNIWLLGFAIFGGCLAIWARLAHERQLKYTREQLENSARINRNDRFIKAIEMLENVGNRTSSREGLNILLNLTDENPKAEYFRCVNMICHWLSERPKNDNSLLSTAIEIFKIKISAEELEEVMKINGVIENAQRHIWPNLGRVNLQGANLEGANLENAFLVEADLRDAQLAEANLAGAYLQFADLRGAKLSRVRLQKAKLQKAKLQKAIFSLSNLQEANLQEANLQNALIAHTNLEKANFKNTNLKSANLLSAKMRGAENLEKKQILSASWSREYHRRTRPKREIYFPEMYLNGKSPELPDYLLDDPKVQKWLSKPVADVVEETIVRKSKTKKSKGKAKKATAKKPKN